MTARIPQSHRDLFEDATPAYAFLATVMADGSPQVTPVWFDVEGDLLRVNTVRGRVKDCNMTARPSVALVIQDPADPYRYVQLRGKVIEASEEGATAHIDKLAGKYTGEAKYAWASAGEERVIYTIRPMAVSSRG
jgi:PPOX class probable F420-dependent enzyme